MIKERIIQIIEYKGIPKEKFYQKIGMTSANFRGEAKSRPLNSNAIENILSEIPDLNIEWLITGKGSMLQDMEVQKPPDKMDETPTMLAMMDRIQELTIELYEAKKEISRLQKEKKATKTPSYGIAAEPELKTLKHK